MIREAESMEIEKIENFKTQVLDCDKYSKKLSKIFWNCSFKAIGELSESIKSSNINFMDCHWKEKLEMWANMYNVCVLQNEGSSLSLFHKYIYTHNFLLPINKNHSFLYILNKLKYEECK